MKFNYSGRTKKGEIKSGEIEASSKESAFNILNNNQIFLTTLEEVAVPFYAKRLKILEKVSGKDIVIFSRQLAIMIKSRVPIMETLRTIARQTRKVGFRDKIYKIVESVEGGSTLSESFSLFPKVFSSFYINMVKSGEASGKLNEIFVHLADYLERENSFRAKLKGAMIYPIFIVIVFIGVVGVIMIYVIPQLTELLSSSGQELPFVTKVVVALSDFLKVFWWLVLIMMVGSVIAIGKVARTKSGKSFFDRAFLKIPFLSGFLKKLYLSRFALNLSTLISGGLPIVDALDITGKVVGSNVYRDVIFETRDGVKKGESMSSILEKHPDLISPLFYQMIVAGEKTGSIDDSLLNVVSFYADDVDRSLDVFVRLLEPIFIIILGGFVAGLMGAVLMPLYSIGLI